MEFTKEMLEERKNHIGASEAAAAIGLSRWKSPLQLWAEKTRQIEPADLSGVLAVELGNELEDFVARKFSKLTGKKVHAVNEAFIHKKHPFLQCHIDRKVEGERSILQCKTCNAWKAKEWEGEEIPQEYIIQEIQELACSGYDKAYIAVLIGNHDFKFKEIVRDMAVEKKVVAKLASFWNDFVIPKVMPMQITKNDDETLLQLFPHAAAGEIIELPDSVNVIIEQLDALSADKKALDGQIKKMKNELKALIKEKEIGRTALYEVRWMNIHRDGYEVKASDYRDLRHKRIGSKED